MRSHRSPLRARVTSREAAVPLHHCVAASCAVVGGGCQREQAGAAVDDFSLPLLSKDRVPLSGRLGDRREAQDRAGAHPR